MNQTYTLDQIQPNNYLYADIRIHKNMSELVTQYAKTETSGNEKYLILIYANAKRCLQELIFITRM